MPVDPSHNPLFRRAARKLTPDDEIDSRRARGEISCAECRRFVFTDLHCYIELI
ncbi:hypothetical protein BJ165DRAFT_1425444 [Panaeolus papilionaceus]|nr:hypothetical protein BJ165DRAFT_1425444 [Panaeolus papilionaceus]